MLSASTGVGADFRMNLHGADELDPAREQLAKPSRGFRFRSPSGCISHRAHWHRAPAEIVPRWPQQPFR